MSLHAKAVPVEFGMSAKAAQALVHSVTTYLERARSAISIRRSRFI